MAVFPKEIDYSVRERNRRPNFAFCEDAQFSIELDERYRLFLLNGETAALFGTPFSESVEGSHRHDPKRGIYVLDKINSTLAAGPFAEPAFYENRFDLIREQASAQLCKKLIFEHLGSEELREAIGNNEIDAFNVMLQYIREKDDLRPLAIVQNLQQSFGRSPLFSHADSRDQGYPNLVTIRESYYNPLPYGPEGLDQLVLGIDVHHCFDIRHNRFWSTYKIGKHYNYHELNRACRKERELAQPKLSSEIVVTAQWAHGDGPIDIDRLMNPLLQNDLKMRIVLEASRIDAGEYSPPVRQKPYREMNYCGEAAQPTAAAEPTEATAVLPAIDLAPVESKAPEKAVKKAAKKTPAKKAVKKTTKKVAKKK